MPADLASYACLLQGFLLALARVAGVAAFAPLPGWNALTDLGKVALVLAMTMLLEQRWPVPRTAIPSLGELVALAFTEAAIGLAIGLIVGVLAEALTMAAQIASLQAGYSYSTIIDPMSRADSGLLPVLYQLAAGMLFIAFGVDGMLISAAGTSFDAIAPASFEISPATVSAVIRLLGGAISAGLRLALPVICTLILTDVGLSIAGRISSHLQLLSLAFPVKMLLALAVLGASVQPLATLYGSLLEHVRQALAVLAAGPGAHVGS